MCPTSTFFNNFQNSLEQDVIHSLVSESLKVYGQDMFYLPKTLVKYDPIYGSSDTVRYDSAYQIEMYVKSIDGFQGDGTFLSKFGLEIRDRIVFTVSRRTFEQDVSKRAEILRPNEGDLIWFPLNQKCFQIKFVDDKPFFYPLGTLVTYDLHCELFEYSGEVINTGIEEIDSKYTGLDNNIFNFGILTSQGDRLLTSTDHYLVNSEYVEPVDSENEMIEEEGFTFIDWSEINPFSEPDVE